MAENRANLKTVISADSTQFNSAMGRAVLRSQQAGMGIARGVGRATAGMAKMGATAALTAGKIGMIGGALAGAAMMKGIHTALELGATLDDLSMRTGVAAGELLVLQKAFELGGVSADKMGGVVNKMQKVIGDAANGATGAATALSQIGLSADQLSRMGAVGQLDAIGKAVMKIEDPAKRAAAAMAIFGRSGGELLPLFASAGVMEEAADSIGRQAEIMTRSAALFARITDRFAAIKTNLQGFFIGFVEPLADGIDTVLAKIASFDFTSLGLRIGDSLMRGIEMFRGAMDSLSVVEMFNLVGLTLKVKFMEAGNELWKMISAVMGLFESGTIQSSLESAALGFKAILLEAAAETAEALAVGAGGKLKVALENAAHFARGSADLADAEKEAIDEGMKNDKSFVDKFKEARDAAKDIFKVPESDLYAIEDGFQKIRVAADKYSMSRVATTDAAAAKVGTIGPSPSPSPASVFEQMGPSRSLMMPKALGSDSAFNRDRERLGVGSGLVTGGLGEKRRLNTKQEKEKEPKEELGFLQSIDRNIKSALTVG
jgi:hypothetical protein